MYFALLRDQLEFSLVRVSGRLPFGLSPLLFHLCENALVLVSLAMRALGHFRVAFDLLLPAHVTGLQHSSST